jgi:TonB family protein
VFREQGGQQVAAARGPAAGQVSAGAYRSQVIAHLTRFKRYPESAMARGAEGVPAVAFSLDASGGVSQASLARSSGQADIDAEVLAMVRRAVPFPQPQSGAPRSFTASIAFRLR